MKHTPVKNKQQRSQEDFYLESIPELGDERRMQYLFSNFPQIESNPKKWEDLRSFWTKVMYPTNRRGERKQRKKTKKENKERKQRKKTKKENARRERTNIMK